MSLGICVSGIYLGKNFGCVGPQAKDLVEIAGSFRSTGVIEGNTVPTLRAVKDISNSAVEGVCGWRSWALVIDLYCIFSGVVLSL